MTTYVTNGSSGGAPLSDAIPQAPGTAAAGVSTAASRGDHVHTPTTAAQAGAPALATLTTRGDIYTRGATTVGRLALGTVGKILRSDGTDPQWSTLTLPDTAVRGTVLVASADNVVSALAASTANTFLGGDGTDVSVRTVAQVQTSLGFGAVTATGATAAAARSAVSAESAVDLLPVSGAVHHWRLSESSSPFADSGSSAVNLAYVAGNREYGRAGVYTRYGATMQRDTTGLTNRAEAVVADIPSGSDLTIGITIANEDRLLNAPTGGARLIIGVTDTTAASNGILLLTSNGTMYFNIARSGVANDTSSFATDWSRPHRIDITRVASTGAYVIYLDGVSRLTGTLSGTIGALTRVSIGGTALVYGTVSPSTLMMTDVSIHLSVLSAATLLSRADSARRLAGG